MPIRSLGDANSRNQRSRVRRATSLIAWRTLSPIDCVEAGISTGLNDLVQIFRPIGPADPHAEDGVGSASQVIGQALKLLMRPTASQVAIDVSMSLVLLHALQGDPTARVLMVFALKRDTASPQLLDDWNRWRPERAYGGNVDVTKEGSSNAIQ